MVASNHTLDQEPPGLGPKVFISYKTREHQQYVKRVESVLGEAGLSIWLDENQQVPPRRSEGLDVALSTGLRKADALLFLVPQGEQRLTWAQMTWGQRLQSILDSLDLVGVGGAREGRAGGSFAVAYFWIMVHWYRFWYGIDIEKYANESWQEWEARVGQAFGSTVIHATVVTGGQDVADMPESVHLLRAEHLEEDLCREVIPLLRRAGAERQRLEVLPEMQDLHLGLQRLGSALLKVLVVFGTILDALERLWEAIMRLPRLVWRTMRGGLSRVRALLRREGEVQESHDREPG